MRAHGARVGLGEVLTAERALAAVDAADRTEVYFALRAALCSTRAEQVAFAAAFTVVFGAEEARSPLDDLGEIAKQALPRVAVPPQGDEAPRPTSRPRPRRGARRSCCARRTSPPTRTPSARSRGGCWRGSRCAAPKRRSRRTVPTKRRRDEHDLRATVRASLRHGGELLERRYREQALRPRRLVLICDVSGSMAPYSRMLLQYMQACVAARARVEAFVFGTRLTRVTRELRGRDSDRALSRAAAAVNDWSGGTRIGEAIAELNREHGRRIGRGSMVILLSDGWDRGEPEQLAEEMARLARTAYKRRVAEPARRRPALRAAHARDEGRDAARRPAAAGQLDRVAGGAGGPDGGGDGVNVAGLILAAGAGTRFGAQTKQLAAAARQAAAAARRRRDERGAAVRRRARPRRRGDPGAGGLRAAPRPCVCEDWARGQGFSLRRGVAALPDADAVVITLGDQPFITPR